MFAMLRPPPQGELEFLYIDQVGVMMIDGKTVTSTTTIAMLFNYDIRIPARFTEKLTKSRAEPRPSRHPQALDHIGPADYLDPNQVGVRDKPLTAEEEP